MTDYQQIRLPSEAEMRKAIQERNTAYDSAFVYGVITTGVFCLPSCAARPARPENLRFFFDSQLALNSGLRECKRCKPLSAPKERKALVNLAQYIAKNAEQKLTLSTLAQRSGLSPTVLQKKFSALFGASPKAFQAHHRDSAFKAALADGSTVTDAIYEAGFGSASRVYGSVTTRLGMSPTTYRSGAQGETISHAASKTKLGWLMLAATDQGVCFAQFGESAQALESQLQAEFPKATLKPTKAKKAGELSQWLAALRRHLEAHAPQPDLPLDLRGTAFQIQVWKFLLQIPPGHCVSYSQVAEGVGRKSAVRAAASACGANRIAMLIPCHRVLRGDGSLGGYRWGTQRKSKLLAQERSNN